MSVDLVHDNKTAVIDDGFDKYFKALSEKAMQSFTGKIIAGKYEKQDRSLWVTSLILHRTIKMAGPLLLVGISLDETKAPWLKAIDKDGLPWIHVSDLKGWRMRLLLSMASLLCLRISSLIRKGVIIAKNIRGEELSEKLTLIK